VKSLSISGEEPKRSNVAKGGGRVKEQSGEWHLP